MDVKLEFIKKFGFLPSGKWCYNDLLLKCELDSQLSLQKNVIYAFSVNNSLTYVGLTTMQLKERMRRYCHPPKKTGNGGGTNIKNNRNILNALNAGHCVDIHVFANAFTDIQCASPERPLHLLEQKLLEVLDPPWNG